MGISNWANAGLKNRIAENNGTTTIRSQTVRAALVFLCAFFTVLSGSIIIQTGSASAETRTLNLYFTHTKESASITFKKNGRYLPRGLKKLNRFLRDWRRNEPTRMDPRLFDLVWEVYRRTGSRQPIKVVSGYRSPKTNAALRRRGRKVATKSQHMKGRALDFFIPGVSVEQIRALGLKAHAGGVGYYRGSFIHLDTGSVRHWPRMSRRQLARVFPRGRTLHVPADGKPMAGYQYALAKYKRRKRTGGPVLLASTTSKKGGFFKRIFGGGLDEEEDNASIRVTAKRPAKKVPQKKNTRLARASVAALSAKSKRNTSSLPGVTLSDVPVAKEQVEEVDSVKIPALPKRVIIPKFRPGSTPAIADSGIAVAKIEADPPTAATIIASRFDPSEPVVPVLRPSLKIENSRFALAAVPELSATQKAAAALAASTPRPALRRVPKPTLTARPVSPERFEHRPPNEDIIVALLGPARSITIPQANPSLTQIALGGRTFLTTPTTIPARDADPMMVINKTALENEPVTKPILASRIDRAFAALSTNINVTPRSRPGASFNPVRSTTPTRKSERTGRNFAELPSDTNNAPKLVKNHLQLGDLDGSEVTAWALSFSTRVGRMAKLTAPRYLGIMKNAPVAIFNNGFNDERFINRTNRFSGQAIKRIAFAKFLTTQLSRNQVFPMDRY